MTAEAAKSRFAVDRKKMVVALLLGFGLETILMFAGDNFLPHRLMNWTQLPGIDLAAYPQGSSGGPWRKCSRAFTLS